MSGSFTRFPGGLKPLMDTFLHASRREVNQNSVTKPGLKQRLVVISSLGPKNSLRSHLTASNSKNFPGGACPQSPLASHSGKCLDQCNFASAGPVHASYSIYRMSLTGEGEQVSSNTQLPLHLAPYTNTAWVHTFLLQDAQMSLEN